MSKGWSPSAPGSLAGKISRVEARDLVDLAASALGELAAGYTDERRNFLAYLMLGVRE